MPRFRSKPTEIEAEQFEVNRATKGVCRCELGVNELANSGAKGVLAHVHTIHNNQPIKLEPGDWVVPEPDGIHFYPIKDEIFRKKYEALNG